MRLWPLLTICLLALAGCADPEPGPTADQDPIPTQQEFRTETVTREVMTPVDWSGNTLRGLWLCDVPNCPYGHFQPGDEFYTSVPFTGDLTRVSLFLNWTQADATQTGLVLALRSTATAADLGTFEGSGSFHVVADVALPGESSIDLRVWPVAKVGENTFIDLTEQPFTVEGVLVGTVEEVVQVAV